MLQLIGSKRVRHNFVTTQQEFSHLGFCDRASPLFAENAIDVFKLFVLCWVIAIITVVIVSVNSEGTHPKKYMYPFSPKLPSNPGGNITLSQVLCLLQ